MVVVSFFVRALLPGTGTDIAKITSHATRTKGRKVATIKGDISGALNNAPTHYFTSPNFHCDRAIKQTSLRSNHPIIKRTAQLGIRHSPDKGVCSSAGRWSLKLIQKELGKVAQDSWILQTVQGLRLEFFTLPPCQVIEQPKLDVERSQALSKEINELCQKRAIIPTTKYGTGFVSPVFVIPKTGEK